LPQDQKIILNRPKEYMVTVCTGLVWLRIGASANMAMNKLVGKMAGI